MYTKVKIFNLALGALLLTKKIITTDTDQSTEGVVLATHWDTALRSTLEDLDLDSTSTQKNLELVTEAPNDLWAFAYKYPTDCSFFRRIQNCDLKDRRSNQIPRRIGQYDDKKVIFTNEAEAIGEYISHGLSLATLSANAGLAVAYKLAWLSAPLVTGKGANKIREDIMKSYILTKTEAQEMDRRENHNFESDVELSEFVEERTS